MSQIVPLKFSIWTEKKDQSMEKENAGSVFFAPYNNQLQTKNRRNKGQHTAKFHLSAFTSISPLSGNFKGGADDNMISTVLALHWKTSIYNNLTRYFGTEIW